MVGGGGGDLIGRHQDQNLIKKRRCGLRGGIFASGLRAEICAPQLRVVVNAGR
jgi:hypothetical protein